MSCDLNLSIVGTFHSCSRAVLGFRFPVWQVVLFLFGVVVTAVDCLVWKSCSVAGVLASESSVARCTLYGFGCLFCVLSLSSWTFGVGWTWMTSSGALRFVCVVML